MVSSMNSLLERLSNSAIRSTISTDEKRRAHPVGQGSAFDRNAVAGEDLGLAVKRQVLGILGHDHVSDQPLGRQPGLNGCAGAGAWVTPARPFGQA